MLPTDAFAASGGGIGVGVGSRPLPTDVRQQLQLHLSLADLFFPKTRNNAKAADDKNAESGNKLSLLNLLSKVPSNESTPKELTQEILQAVRVLEKECPTLEADVLPKLAGNWELLWTAQDLSSLPTTNPFATFINPLENQSYSNNPSGRSNPILPQNVQDGLEDIGLLSNERKDGDQNTIKSTQAINLKKNRIRNVVAFEANNPTPLFSNKDGKTRGFITVDVKGAANPNDARKIDVKFDRFRVSILDSPLDVSFPLGVVGPTGWLRTGYVDDDIRVTRGHKGSVFILSRTAK
eukprot:CAMPEP_0202019458 /NCGR_PEP_ID=MMETSP0905-20130828/42055_1 /ASSEMBLY_ACC=CAM_ASM_000554 /TAXON_ID=420261 /ORGANISM="Thalassiosira antarctica, Strain CCMP982" /LENGTH=293 /DNA_ID=CAMNT_0048580733 /DNA_START=73 /DNA_END=954 /DNA_ORIENTATION=-